jgi:hypothetical protein
MVMTSVQVGPPVAALGVVAALVTAVYSGATCTPALIATILPEEVGKG